MSAGKGGYPASDYRHSGKGVGPSGPHAKDPSAGEEQSDEMAEVDEHWKKVKRALDAEGLRLSRQSASDRQRLQKTIAEEDKEIARLRTQNERLLAEVQRLKGAVPGASQVAPAAAPVDVTRASAGRANDDTRVTFEKLRTLQHDQNVHGVTFQHKSRTIATASWDGTVRLFEADADSYYKKMGGKNVMEGLYCVAFAKTLPDVLACASADTKVYLWNQAQGTMKAALEGHGGEVNGIDFHEMQHVMCTVSDDKTARIWDFQEATPLRTLDGHDEDVYGTAFLGEINQYLVGTCCLKGGGEFASTRIFDMRDKKVVTKLQDHTDDIIGIEYSGKLNTLATAADDGQIILYDVRNWSPVQKISVPPVQRTGENMDQEVKRIAFNPNSDMLAAATASGSVFVYVNDGQWVQKARLDGHSDCVFDVAWGANQSGATILVSASHDKTSTVWQQCGRL